MFIRGVLKMSSLVILTSRFPYPPGEEFLKNEVEELAKYFTSIKIIPTNSEIDQNENNRKQVPKNVEVINPPSLSNDKFSLVFKLLSDYQALAWFKKELPIASRHGIKAVLKLLNWTAIASEMKQQIKKNRHIDLKEDTIFYSYWLTPSATALAMLKEQNPNMKVVSRVHGGDLYLERHQPAYLPYQGKVIQIINQTFSISENGKNYLSKLYPDEKMKISVNRLGTRNEIPFIMKKEKEDALNLISCSYLKPVKRVHLLAEALKNIDFPLEWTHVGDGPEREKIEALVKDLPSNIQVKFMGNLSNDKVMELYKTNPYDLFINVSESEGIPVTIMEAFSYGIPAVATDVGGTSELVHSESGFLLSKDFDPKDLAQILRDYAQLDLDDQNKKAKSAYDTWDYHYNAVKNYQKFAEALKGVTN
jgi:glycosyltransferase involved in cell wall biosynthesis